MRSVDISVLIRTIGNRQDADTIRRNGGRTIQACLGPMAHVDVAAMRLVFVAQRSARRDFVDLYVILHQMPFSAVAARAVQRYGAGLIEPVVIGKGFTWFEDADGEPDPQYLGQSLPWGDVKAFFTSSFRQFVLDLDAALASAAPQGIRSTHSTKPV